MSDIKSLFEKSKAQKVLSDASLNKVGRTIESADYVKEEVAFQNQVIPYINFSSASNFARYGSAEKYYEDSINYIKNEWPYDGSQKEKIEWQINASYLDRHIFENSYPRTTGYIKFGNDYGTITPDANGYDTSTKEEYIRFKGSSNLPTGSTTLREDFAKYNMYNTSSQGLYTTELNGNRGYSVEFWFKKDGYSAGNESQKQIFFDLWNSSSANEGRLKIEADMSAVPNVFTVNVKSGSAEFSATLGSSLDITGSDWHHYSFTFANSGPSTVAKLYVDGDLNDSSTATDSIGLVTGSMIGNIGAMITAYDSSGSANAGKLSGSLDDFRYWKSTRTEEEIGRNWFCQIDGGTNTDIQNIATSSAKYSYENPVDLGLYYKFNEGIINSTSIDSTDARVLDYSGRVTNGSWTGYSAGARFTGSAMVESSASLSEFQDPIIYSNHPSVITLLQEKKDEGREHDFTNNANVYKSIPAWIIEEDQRFDVNQGVLQNLTQIMASYFDTLQLQIEALPSLKDNEYVSGSDKPLPFSNRLVDNLGLTTSEIFSNATDLEYLASKDDFRQFSAKLNETKNLIYQNVHNNLTYIYKSKGTEKSFRNLIRCFGVDDELVNINLYGNNVTFEILDNTENTIVQKRYASFSDSQNHNATVFQSSSATNTNSRSYISASDEMTFRGLTFESEVHFPKQFPQGSEFYNRSNFLTSSLFGCHASDTTNSWSSPDYGNFQVQSVRTEQDSKSVYFQLTGTAGSIFPNLTSSVFKDVYDDSRWLFALKIKPSTYPLADGVSGSGDSPDYDISFAGYNYVLDVLVDSFEVTSSVTYASGSAFATANKRMFVGAHRTNFTGSVLEQSDVESTSLRAWMDYIDTDVIKAHAKDVLNFGPERPNRNAYITQLSKSIGDNIANIPQLETLALHWNFDNVTGSDGSGQFTVADFSSGSVALTNRWGWLGPISKYQHTGLGYGFEASSTSAIDRKYVHSAQQQLPETLQSGDMVSIIDDTTNQIFSRDSRPVDYNFAFEKSMYRIISQDMLKYFATMADFNNLIGAPINRYRQQYKDMENFRQLYFERIGNDPDFDKFVEYFKWIDSAIVTMLLQLAPASSRFNDRLRNMVESHVLERNKYWNKFPTLEMKVSDPEAGLRGITELTYPWSRGSAPLSNLQKDNCLWWSDRTKRQNSVITSGDSNVDADRETIRLSNDFRSDTAPTLAVSRDSTATTTTYQGQAYAIRNFTKPYRLVVDESAEIHGGSNFPRAKKVEYTHASLNVGSATQLEITASDFDFEKDCDDIINPNAKERLETKVQNTSDSEGYKSGKSTILAPFSLFSSSVDTGYASEVSSSFRANTEIANYHDDSYGDDKGIPMQGPFTQAHVGGRQHRHVNFREQTVADRPEAWNLAISSQNMTISSRTVSQPRATMIRDEYAKRALNLRNIKWGTGSFVAGNYRKDYEMIQTSDRNINDRYFVKAEGQQPTASDSPFLTGTIDYTLPRFDLTGTNDYIFVERFNAPGGQDVSSRGMLDWKSEQFAIYNDLNFRNLGVRRPLNEWYTEHCGQFGIKSGSSVRELDYNTLASYHKVNRNPRHTVEENNSCSVDYDNWWVQHAIPQSVYQYAWVTASVTKSECDTFGYVSNFSIPSGTTSTTQSALPFVEEGHVSAGGINADFAGLNTLINDPVLSASNTLSSSDGDYRNTSIATINTTEQLNALNLHRNGPYQYPSWKQTRTGETPVARYHKNNNILSIGNTPTYVNLDGTTYLPNRPGSFKNFVEPPVSFKYKPLLTSFGENSAKVRNTYGNNKGHFSLGIALTQSVDDFIKITDREDPQAWDMFNAVTELRTAITANRYSEVIYPREMMTGLAETRGRTNYSEVATVDSNNSASLSNGANGIDRGPLLRRTYWRDSETLRNRISGSRTLQTWGMLIPYLGTSSASPTPVISPQQAITTLPNSQGFRDGNATSIYGIGSTPFKTLKTQATGSAYSPGQNPPEFESYPAWNISGNYSSYGDIGELNSHDPYKVTGYLGTAKGSAYWDGTDTGSSSWAAKLTFFPTASAYYYHVQANYSSGSAYRGNMNVPWRVSELSGKYPWFDSYDDYAQDIRVMAKNYSILPEFRISQHMDYYLRNGIEVKNDKFLTLDGASITASAQENSTIGGRDFDTTFFNEYSNSDFQKYFGTFSSDSKPRRITLRANAVKKLLPYHGFYPIHRSLQLASMFSQSLGPYISGDIDSNPRSNDIPATGTYSFDTKPLNMQSLLQPYYAPGIMYNTIKSGIAVDWAAFTGSFPSSFAGSYPATIPFQDSANYRIPFESILDPLGTVGIPNSSSGGEGSLFLSYPSWGLAASDAISGNPTIFVSTYSTTGRTPFVDITTNNRSNASIDPNYTSYMMAANNFWAEIPNFFLENSSLKSIESSKQQYQVQLSESKAYYMDVYCRNVSGTTMFSDGRFFGPNFLFTNDSPNTSPVYSTDASAPIAHTPSYFYGEQILRIKYVATAQDATEFSFQRLFENSTYESINIGRDNYLTSINSDLSDTSPAIQSAMSITSSFNVKGILAEPQIQRDDFGTPRSETNIPNAQRFRWVISPKMETPILDFSDQPVIDSQSGRGMWSGYGSFPTTGKGIEFGVRDSFPGNQVDTNLTGSLIEACFDNQAPSQKLGVLADKKRISEAIVAIPYIEESIPKGVDLAPTTPIIGKNFFEVDVGVFQAFKNQYNDYKGSSFADYVQQKESKGESVLQGESIRKMIEIMDKYVIPPELDFLTFNGVNPFVMYMFEFNHDLDSQDLSDIWQGVMPEISRTAEKSDPSIDNNEFSHPTGGLEFFHRKSIPEKIRWIVFKVKKKANNNYYATTPQNVGSAEERNAANTEYSYNWPYDHFSLVELAQIETINDFEGELTSDTRERTQVEQALDLGNLPGDAGSS